MRVLSLGAGIQSTTLLLMSDRGDLPRLDCAIFADTQWEPREVYEHLDWLEGEVSIPIHRVTGGDLRTHTMQARSRGTKEEGERYASIPLRVLNPDGSQGMIRRQCTREYKVEPVEKFIRRELLGLAPRQRAPARAVELWFGISVDEMRRVRMPDAAWKTHEYPLIGLPTPMLERSMSRQACIAWLAERYPHRHIPRSACIGCPFRTNREWRAVRRDPEQWADAVEVDEAIRAAEDLRGQAFLHRSCEPLATATLDDEDQGALFGLDDECLGYCGS